jgi:N-acetylglucosamine-6-sulfatase
MHSTPRTSHCHLSFGIVLAFFLCFLPGLKSFAADKPRNIIFILSDDHRWDFFHFMPEAPKFLETPNLDRLAREGANFRNMFVSTSLCSPSRASILTGLYMHHHHVADNQRLESPGLRYFPEYLQSAGYETAFFGKWHMGEDSDAPRKGFNYWAAFRGQGEYFDPVLNINGERKAFKGYNTDILTDLAVDWLKQPHDKPFFIYLAYKAPHFPFEPAPRHRGRYEKEPVPYPPTMANTEENYETQPRWVRERRFSIHGVDHMETGRFDNDPVPSFENLYHRYAEAVYSTDEDVGRILKQLDDTGLSNSTLILYMGDNGFELGEHGFYDKRDAFETSMRVPLLAWAPGAIKPGTVVPQLVQNIDIAPSILQVAGAKPPADRPKMDGSSFWPLLQGRDIPWRDHILYEYYWERNFPATPTTLALRTNRWKYVYYHGVWDKDSFYDLQSDPLENHNLINVPAYQDQIAQFRKQLFDEMEKSGGLNLPIQPPSGEVLDQRKFPR